MARDRQDAGFTLAELLVASTLLAIVMTAVYTSFNTSIHLWKIGSSDLTVYQEARLATSLMTRELQSVIGGTGYLFIGDKDELEFFTVGPSMDPGEGRDARVLWVKYELQGSANSSGKTLRRREAFVEGPLPLESLEDPDRVELGRLRIGSKRDFDLAEDLKDVTFSYWWIPPADPNATGPDGEPDFHREPIVKKENKEGTGLPQGVRISFTVNDPYEEKGEKEFTTFITFCGPTTELDNERLDQGGGI